ncbi:tetratricopeptide repeat protein [Lignipirellula cremea]|uniref:Tetratricopeptide repeat protein n=1 Tax=Lignipirellula cremea TaxID=2528010 RepID=A0A518E3R0_9BACT|nr:tetratricopeptide repeat protein [Lignipirellula cremea]QDU98712.1 Tetratricopeptide repeat protein [Lignipirellula cremea]
MLTTLSRYFPILSLVLLAAGASGCTTLANLNVQRPAELDIPGVERIVVLDFDGPENTGKIARSALTAQLWENKFFTLVDQSELDQQKTPGWDDEGPDVQAAIAAGRRLGVDAVLTGSVVSYKAVDDVSHHTKLEMLSSDEKSKISVIETLALGFQMNETLNRDATVTLAFKLIDVRSGQIRAARQTSHTFSGKVTNGEGDLPAKERVLNDMLTRCARDVVVMIAPHQESIPVALDNKWIWEAGSRELSEGNKQAAQGDWEGAATHYEKALAASPNDHSALYSLGLVHEARGEYLQAERCFADAVRQESRTHYQMALVRVSDGKRRNQQLLARHTPTGNPAAAIARRDVPPANHAPGQPSGPASQPVSYHAPPHGAGPPAAHPASYQTAPPGNYPPGNYPPGNYPPGNYPPGNAPAQQYPPGNYPPGNAPAHHYPALNQPAGPPGAGPTLDQPAGPPPQEPVTGSAGP